MRNITVKASPLTNVVGRVDYISNPKRQEHLVAFYQTTDEQFWKSLADFSQEQKKFNPTQKVCEAREYVITLPNIFARLDAQKIAFSIADWFKRNYGVEGAVGVHWNKTMTNYHVHLVFSERKLLNLENEKSSIATRNTYFDEAGKRSTKGVCVDENGDLKPGCRLVLKGEELHPIKKFGPKINEFADKSFLLNRKKELCSIFNKMLDRYFGDVPAEELEDMKLKVYHKTDPELPLTNLVRGEPQELREVKEKLNEAKREYNSIIKELLKKEQITNDEALEIKSDIQEDLLCKGLSRVEKLNFYLMKVQDKISSLMKKFKDVLKHLGADEVILKTKSSRASKVSEERSKESEQLHPAIDALIGNAEKVKSEQQLSPGERSSRPVLGAGDRE